MVEDNDTNVNNDDKNDNDKNDNDKNDNDENSKTVLRRYDSLCCPFCRNDAFKFNVIWFTILLLASIFSIVSCKQITLKLLTTNGPV